MAAIVMPKSVCAHGEELLVGVTKSTPFQLRVQADGEAAANHEGVYTSRPIIPAPVSILLLLLFVAMIGGAWWLLNNGGIGGLGSSEGRLHGIAQ